MAAAEVTAGSPTLSFSIKRMTEHDLLEVVEIEELSGPVPGAGTLITKSCNHRKM